VITDTQLRDSIRCSPWEEQVASSKAQEKAYEAFILAEAEYTLSPTIETSCQLSCAKAYFEKVCGPLS
jgi:hypothetical protein